MDSPTIPTPRHSRTLPWTMTDMTAAPFPVPPLARQIFAAAGDIGCEARIVGGAVRDWLLATGHVSGEGATAAKEPADIDMAIACPIADAAAALRRRKLKIVETGLAHGTVTVIGDGALVELTQTRVDLETDGRHAVIGFTDDWAEDARRRDFTVNALYVREDGTVEDPIGGLPDLMAGRLRFVGDARMRIAEDRLRMLRYCRFLPRFGEGGVDPAAREAITAMAAQVETLSAERIAHELRYLFAAPRPQAGVQLLHDTRLDQALLGLRLQPDALALLPPDDAVIAALASTAHLKWLVCLTACLGGDVRGDAGSGKVVADRLAKRLRLSRAESRYLASLCEGGAHVSTGDNLAGQGWQRVAWFLHRTGGDPAAIYIASMARSGQAVSARRMDELAGWCPPKCPITAADLLSHGVDKGPQLGEMLSAIERHWVMQDFTPTREELLATLQ